MTDEQLDTTTELKPRRKRGAVAPAEVPQVSPLREEEAPSYPVVGEPELSEIDNPTMLRIAEMWADEVTDKDRDRLEAAMRTPPRANLDPKPRGLHTKLAEVMAVAGRIPKRGKAPAAMGGFEFVQVGDAADVIRKALAERKITMLPELVEVVDDGLAGTVFVQSKTKSGADMTTLTIKTTWRLTDADSGETATIQSLGTGADTFDKFSPKAQTNAMKYAFLMGFLLSTGDDPEAFDLSDSALGDPVIGDSSIEGVAVGGRQSKVTAPQLDAIRRLVSTNGLSAERLLMATDELELTPEQEVIINDWDPELPESDQRKAAMAFIGGFSFAQAGQLIRRLEAL